MKNNRGITLIALIITIIVMLILVGVTVNVALNGGLFSTAKQAASGMQMAQIRERAEVVKATLIAEAQSNNSIIVSKTEYKNRLLQEFEGSTAVGSKVVVENSKYDIIIKNTDLDIEVVEHLAQIGPESLLDFSYELANIEANEKKYGIDLKLNMKSVMTADEYQALKESQEVKNEELTFEQKKEKVMLYLSEEMNQEISSLDQYVVTLLNSNADVSGVQHDNIDDWLTDPIILQEFGKDTVTKEELYAALFGSGEETSLTEEQVIEIAYEDMTHVDYYGEYNQNTSNLKLYLLKDGKEELLSENIYLEYSQNYIISENGKYEFIVKTSEGEVVTSEIFKVNNIEADNPYVLTEEEASRFWSYYDDIEGFTISNYLGEEIDVIVPSYIGQHKVVRCAGTFNKKDFIKSVIFADGIQVLGGSLFFGCTNLERVVIPEGVKTIDRGCFAGCTNLKEITIPNSVSSIYNGQNGGFGAFYRCTNLTTINFAPGDNPIPEGQPWGAPNENLVVTKLTE